MLRLAEGHQGPAVLITAVDTNVLLDIFGADTKFGAGSAEAMQRCLREGTVVACEAVWVETATAFLDSEKFRRAMSDLAVFFEPMSEEAAMRLTRGGVTAREAVGAVESRAIS
jgi:predicted nucleic acid-binding protein